MTPNNLLNYWRCADTHEVREILEAFQKVNSVAFDQLASLVKAFPFKRKPTAYLTHANSPPSRL